MMFVADHKALRYFLTLENSTKIEKEGLCSRNDEGTICDSTQLLKPNFFGSPSHAAPI